jgi:hypothetical protein
MVFLQFAIILNAMLRLTEGSDIVVVPSPLVEIPDVVCISAHSIRKVLSKHVKDV